MHVPARLPVALLFALAALPAAAARESCPRGDTASLLAGADRALVRGDWPEASRRYACIAVESTDAGIAERATRAAWDNFQLERAVGSARRWLELAPENEVARRYLATGLLRLYDEDAAADQFAALLETSYADRARGYLVLLGILSAEDNATGAARVMDRLAAADPSLPEAQFAAGMLWQRAEDGAKAIAAIDRALALKPDWPQAQYARVRALAGEGKRAEALGTSARLADSGDPLMRLSHAWQLLAAERRDESAALFEELAAQRRPGRLGEPRSRSRRLRSTRSGSRTPTASCSRRTAIPSRPRARAGCGRGSRRSAAIWPRPCACTRPSIRARARSPPSCAPTACCARRARPSSRRLLLDDFQAASPVDTADVVSGVGAILVDEGRGDEAIALLDRALEVLPDDGLLLARGFLLERIDRVPEAVADMREVAGRRPNDPMTLNALGYTLVDRTKSVAEGTEFIERAIAAKPDSYAIQDSMGWALVQSGQLEEGKAWLERAWELSEDPEVAAHLGETLWRMGRPADAKQVWDEALADNPDSPPLKRAIERRAQ